MATKRYKDIVIFYETDLNRQIIVKQRVYKVMEDESIQTPITPMLLAARESTDFIDLTGSEHKVIIDILKEITAALASNIKGRHLLCCLINPYNSQGFSEFRVVIPYKPGSWKFCAHAKEIINFPKVESANYHGEEWLTMGGLLKYLRQ